jgi:hypothetical protein
LSDDLAQALLVMSRKPLTLFIRTLVMRDLVRHRAHLIRRYLRRQGINEPWGDVLPVPTPPAAAPFASC